jgi:integrase/recombinase XerD
MGPGDLMVSRRGNVPPAPPSLAAFIESFDLVLRVNEKSERTREMYCDIARWFAGWLTAQNIVRWTDVGKDELRRFFLHLDDLGYAKSYRNNAGRCLQAFFKWYAEEEQAPNPFVHVKPPPPPRLGEKLPPVLEAQQLATLIKDAEKGRDFASRRDAALLRMFMATGCRLSEITNLRVSDVSIKERQAVVTGKGRKMRIVKFEHLTALALDRYLRKRAEHVAADLDALWLGERRRVPMTPSGVRQVIERRGERLGLDIYPHLFRHTFSHNWLDAGGAEGDLMELNGWDSPQMLAHYGRSARSARARRAYDRVMGAAQ